MSRISAIVAEIRSQNEPRIIWYTNSIHPIHYHVYQSSIAYSAMEEDKG